MFKNSITIATFEQVVGFKTYFGVILGHSDLGPS